MPLVLRTSRLSARNRAVTRSSLVYGFCDFLGGLKSRSLPLISVLLVSQASGLLVAAVIERASVSPAGAGIALALGGIAIISSAGSEEGPARDPRRSVVFGLLTALGFGGYLVAMDASSEGHVGWALLSHA